MKIHNTATCLLSMLLISVLLSGPVAAQKREPDREKDGLKGPVRSVRVEIVTLDNDGKPDKNGRWLSRVTTYDPHGNKTEDETFYAFGKISYGRVVYKYDARGRLVEEARYLNDSILRMAYAYNDEKPHPSSREAHKLKRLVYDKEGRLKEIIRSELSDNSSWREVIKYDDRGREIGAVLYDNDGSLLAESVKTYDEKGRVISEVNGKAPDDRFYRKTAYAYNEKGNITREEEYDNEGLFQLTTYAYDGIDGSGNWTRRTATRHHKRDGKAVEETYRTIAYYGGISSTPAVDNTEKRDVKRPRLLNNPRANYTDLAAANKVEGVVRLRVLIGEDGKVMQVRVVGEGLPYGLNEEAVRTAFLMKFEPARIDGKPTKYWQAVDVEFKR